MFGVAVGMLINLVISWIAPGPLPRARQAQDTHLYLHDNQNITILREFNHDKLRALSSRVIAGRSLTYEAVSGKGRLFTRDEWRKLRNQLESRELIYFGRGGVVVITEKGNQMFSRLARGER